MKFKYADYYFSSFIILVIIGFWPTYFSKFFDGTANFSQYFHFHAVTAVLWLLLLIVQPMLIRTKKFRTHRLIGKFSYILVPILFISIILLAHFRLNPDTENLAWRVWIPFKDLFIFSFGFGVAIRYRKTVAIHARGMVVAGMALIEPTMVRMVVNVFGIEQPLGYYLGIAPIYIILIILIIKERNEVKGRWVFKWAIGLFLFVHVIRIFKIILPFWDDFAHWYISLPLT